MPPRSCITVDVLLQIRRCSSLVLLQNSHLRNILDATHWELLESIPSVMQVIANSSNSQRIISYITLIIIHMLSTALLSKRYLLKRYLRPLSKTTHIYSTLRKWVRLKSPSYVHSYSLLTQDVCVRHTLSVVVNSPKSRMFPQISPRLILYVLICSTSFAEIRSRISSACLSSHVSLEYTSLSHIIADVCSYCDADAFTLNWPVTCSSHLMTKEVHLCSLSTF